MSPMLMNIAFFYDYGKCTQFKKIIKKGVCGKNVFLTFATVFSNEFGLMIFKSDVLKKSYKLMSTSCHKPIILFQMGITPSEIKSFEVHFFVVFVHALCKNDQIIDKNTDLCK